MCDYSLMAVPNRLARQGEELVTHRFPTGSLGLASPEDLKRASQASQPGRKTIWQAILDFFDPPTAPPVCAVCIPPGARLEMLDIPARLQQQWCVKSDEEVCFTQLSASVNTYRDAVRFAHGLDVRLQDMREGMRFRVLDMTGASELELASLREIG